MFILRVTKTALAWKLAVLVMLVAGTTSYLLHPPAGPEDALMTAAQHEPGVSLVFEVPWGELEVPQILAVLSSHGARATFEADPAWIQAYPDMARRIRRAGHVLVARAYAGEPSLPALAPATGGRSLEERTRFVADEVLKRSRPGATLRLPADDLSPATARALPRVLEQLRAREMTVETPARNWAPSP